MIVKCHRVWSGVQLSIAKCTPDPIRIASKVDYRSDYDFRRRDVIDHPYRKDTNNRSTEA